MRKDEITSEERVKRRRKEKRGEERRHGGGATTSRGRIHIPRRLGGRGAIGGAWRGLAMAERGEQRVFSEEYFKMKYQLVQMLLKGQIRKEFYSVHWI